MKVFHCGFEGCGKSFPKQKKLEDHMNVHTNSRPYKCDMCERSYMRNSHLMVHKKKHFPPEFKCERCGYMCHTKDRSEKHKQTCIEYQCEICRKKYTKKAWFDVHVESHHTKTFNRTKKEHLCGYCKFTFYKKSNLKVHIRSVHLLLKPFKCVCGKEYAHAASLDRHKRKCKGFHPNGARFSFDATCS